MNKPNVLDLLDKNTFIGNVILPFFVVKNNIIFCAGKCGTTTLNEVCDYGFNDSSITSKELLSMINQGFTVHFVIRDPLERFRSGIIQEWAEAIKYHFECYNIDIINIEAFVLYHLSTLEANNNIKEYSYQFHIGNWLTKVIDIINYIPKETPSKIWDLREISELLNFLEIEPVHKNYTPRDSSLVQHTARVKLGKMYDNLSKTTENKILEYLNNEIAIYNQLIKMRQSL